MVYNKISCPLFLNSNLDSDDSINNSRENIEHSTLFDYVGDSTKFACYDDVFVIKNVSCYEVNNEGIGIKLKICEKEQDYIVVKCVNRNSIWNRILKKNDIILSVNNINLSYKGCEKVLDNILNNDKEKIYFDIRRRCSLNEMVRIKINIQINRRLYVLGLHYSNVLSWQRLNERDFICGFFITYIEKESDYYGLLQIGDIIICVNNITISSKTKYTIEHDLIKPSTDIIEMMIYRFKSSIEYGDQLFFINPIFKNGIDELVSDSILKIYKFRKISDVYGMNIVGGFGEYPIFVAGVERGSIAHLIDIHTGDQILKINNLETFLMEQVDFVRLMKYFDHVIIVSSGNVGGLKKFYSYIEYLNNYKESWQYIDKNFNKNILYNEKKNEFIVRALYNYDPSIETNLPCIGLKFEFGDLLFIQDGTDSIWWRAEKLDEYGAPYIPSRIGVIPSEKIYLSNLTKENKNVKFTSSSPQIIRNNLRRLSFKRSKSQISSYSICEEESIKSLDKLRNLTEIEIKPYINIKKIINDTNILRPVIILGIFREKIMEKLIKKYYTKFKYCPIHTTRPISKISHTNTNTLLSTYKKKIYINNDIFIKSYNKNEYIEINTYDGYFYGTYINDITSICRENYHAILNVSYNCIKKLELLNIYPIVIYIKFNKYQLISYKNIDDIKKMINNSELLYKYYRNLFTDELEFESFDTICDDLFNIINKRQYSPVWVEI